jgi:hypothetical protein
MLGFDFRVEYKLRASNVVADALSRHDSDDLITVHALSAPLFWLLDDLRAEASTYPE